MRKTSQDGGDSTSITSGYENEIRKPGANKIKSKRNSFQKRVHNFSVESDDAAIEPLLQKEKDKTEIAIRSDKLLLTKCKAQTSFDKGSDTDKLLSNTPDSNPNVTTSQAVMEHVPYSNGINESNSIIKAITENHMNINIFQEITSPNITTKSQVYIEITEGKQKLAYNPNHLIFTVAKIHTDNRSKQMEPVQVTPGPISSTTEGITTSKTSAGLERAQVGTLGITVQGKNSSTNSGELPKIISPSVGMAKKNDTASSHSVQVKDKLSIGGEHTAAEQMTEKSIPTSKVSKDITLSELTKMADLKTVYDLADIQKSSGILKDVAIIQSTVNRENKEIHSKQTINEDNLPTDESSGQFSSRENPIKISTSMSITSDVNKNVTRKSYGDLKLSSAIEVPSKSCSDKIPSVNEKLTKTPSITKSLQRQKTTTEDTTSVVKSKSGTTKAEKQNTAIVIPKTTIDKTISNTAFNRSSSKSTESSVVSNKKTATTQVTKNNTAAPSAVKSISKIPSSTSVNNSKSTHVAVPKQQSNKTSNTKLSTGTNPSVSSQQTKGLLITKPGIPTSTSKASTVSTIISSNSPQSSTKISDVTKKSALSSMPKTNASGSGDKQSTVSTMKTSSNKSTSPSVGTNKPASSKPTAASNSTNNK